MSENLRERYLRVKNSNKNTSGYGVFLAVLAISGRFQRVLVLPLTAYNISFMKQRFSPVSLSEDITNLCLQMELGDKTKRGKERFPFFCIARCLIF